MWLTRRTICQGKIYLVGYIYHLGRSQKLPQIKNRYFFLFYLILLWRKENSQNPKHSKDFLEELTMWKSVKSSCKSSCSTIWNMRKSLVSSFLTLSARFSMLVWSLSRNTIANCKVWKKVKLRTFSPLSQTTNWQKYKKLPILGVFLNDNKNILT